MTTRCYTRSMKTNKLTADRLTMVGYYHHALPGQTVVAVQTADLRVPASIKQIASIGEPYTVGPDEYWSSGDHNSIGTGFALVDDDGRREV